MLVATVLVGFTSTRPIAVDEHFTYVTVAADSEVEATLVAAQMAACLHGCVMPTSTQIVALTL